jgi:CubicO group peptidase (beta-lactamase class C family)
MGIASLHVCSVKDLQDALNAGVDMRRTGVAVVYRRSDLSAAISAPSVPDFTPETRVHVGCLAKTLTAMLVACALRERRISLEDPIDIAEIRVRHLLNHTHGLDEPRMDALPRRADGLIDTAALRAALACVPAIVEPEVLFNYGGIGCWLLAALLESSYQKPYSRLLTEKLFEPAGVDVELGDGRGLCPSGGGDLRLSAVDLDRLLELHPAGLDGEVRLIDDLIDLCRTHGCDAPAWPPMGRRVGPGLADFGGSFGYSGKGGGGSALVRVVPGPRTHIIVTAAQKQMARNAFRLLSGLHFADAGLRAPGPLPTEEWQERDLTPFLGVYENSRYSVAIDLGARRTLRMRAFRRDSAGRISAEPHLKRYLDPAVDDYFHPQVAEPIAFPTVQFIHHRAGVFRILRTGLHVFARVASEDAEPQHGIPACSNRR